MTSLADKIISASLPERNESDNEKFVLEEAIDRFFRLNPSTCRVDDYIVCSHEVITDDPKTMVRLLDHPKAKLSFAESAWLFRRIQERAPKLNSRYIVVSNEYIWDREDSALIPIILGVKTTNNETTRRRIYEQRQSDSGVGKIDVGGEVYEEPDI